MNSLVMTNSPFPTALLKTTQNHPAEGTVRFGVWAKINTSVTWQISDQCGISLGRGRGQCFTNVITNVRLPLCSVFWGTAIEYPCENSSD